MAYGTLIVEIEDYVALIRLNRPEALNALNSRLVAELVHAIAEAEANDKVRCLVITGSEKAFAAGADIKEMSTKSYIDVFTEDFFGPLSDAFRRARKPVIAAVNGWALGGGCELAMTLDLIVAGPQKCLGGPPGMSLMAVSRVRCRSRRTRGRGIGTAPARSW